MVKDLLPFASGNAQATKDLNQACVNFVNVIEKRSKVLKKMKQLKHKIHSDMPALLPNPIIDFHTQTPGQTHTKVDEVTQLGQHNITKRSLIAIAGIVSGVVKGASIIGNIISGAKAVAGMMVDEIHTIINYKKAKAMNAAIKTLNQRASLNNEQVVRVRDHLLCVSKTSLKDIQGNRKMLYHMYKDLDRIYRSVGILQNVTEDKFETMLVNEDETIANLSRMILFSMAHLDIQLHKYQELTQTIDHFLDGLSTINTGRLSQSLVSPDVLHPLLTRVVADIIKRNPDFLPVFTNLQSYYEQVMTSFTNTKKMLIVQIPILFRNRVQKAMNLYKMVTVPVPFDRDTYEENQNTYTQLKLKEDHITITDDAYITLHGHQLQGCYRQEPTYYCESLHVTSHTSEHNCASSNNFQASAEKVDEKCRFIYYHDHIPEPKILETQSLILLSNLPRP